MRWLAEPAWLLALLALPLLWWLHRFRSEDRTHRVSALFLMPKTTQTTAGRKQKDSADSLWWLRAAIAAALICALANPALFAQRPITVWIDDSISMYTVENGETRISHALRLLDEQLSQTDFSVITIRALSAPQEPVVLSLAETLDRYDTLNRRFAEPGAEPDTPAPAQIETASRHWVVTDHADDRVNHWLSDFVPERIISTGSETENLVLGEFSLRPALLEKDTLFAHVRVHNVGHQTATAKLIAEMLASRETKTVFEREILLQPGSSESVGFQTAAPSATDDRIGDPVFSVKLEANDTLQLDNVLTLTTPKKIRISFGESCGSSLRTALSVHPGVAITSGLAEAQIICGANGSAQIPAIVIQPGNVPVATATAHWMAGNEGDHSLSLDISRLAGIARQPIRGQILMATGDIPLITRSDTNVPRINVLFDLNDASLASQAAYPLLVAGLLDNLTGINTLESVNRDQHSVAASRVAPQVASQVASKRATGIPLTAIATQVSRVTSYSWVLVSLALFLLIVEQWVLRRRRIQGGPLTT